MLTVISVTRDSDSSGLCIPSVVTTSGSVAVAEAGGGGGGGATPQVVISPARADMDSTTSNVTAIHSFRTWFISFSPEVGGWFLREQREAVPRQALPRFELEGGILASRFLLPSKRGKVSHQ